MGSTASLFRLPTSLHALVGRLGQGVRVQPRGRSQIGTSVTAYVTSRCVCSKATILKSHHIIICTRWKTDSGCSCFRPVESYKLFAQWSRRIRIIAQPIHFDPEPGGKERPMLSYKNMKNVWLLKIKQILFLNVPATGATQFQHHRKWITTTSEHCSGHLNPMARRSEGTHQHRCF